MPRSYRVSIHTIAASNAAAPTNRSLSAASSSRLGSRQMHRSGHSRLQLHTADAASSAPPQWQRLLPTLPIPPPTTPTNRSRRRLLPPSRSVPLPLRSTPTFVPLFGVSLRSATQPMTALTDGSGHYATPACIQFGCSPLTAAPIRGNQSTAPVRGNQSPATGVPSLRSARCLDRLIWSLRLPGRAPSPLQFPPAPALGLSGNMRLPSRIEMLQTGILLRCVPLPFLPRAPRWGASPRRPARLPRARAARA